jgi:subtilisin family serine protease
MFSYRMMGQRTFWLFLLIMSLTILFAVWMRPTAAQTAPSVSPRLAVAAVDPPLAYMPGVVLVKLKPGVRLVAKPGVMAANAAMSTNHPGLEQALQASGVSSAEALFPVSVVGTERIADVDNPLARIYRLRLATDANLSTAVELLRTIDAVEYAEPDYLAQAALIPNDPAWGNQWALNKINAPAAWDVTKGATTTIIALIDSGIDLAHPDLVGKLWQNDDVAGNGIDDDQNGKIDDRNGWNFVTESNNVVDLNGHGTQVAGVAGASTNNGLGMAGLCWHCPLMPVVAMQANGVANYSTIANAVVYAAANGASVINLSLGGYADSSLLREAIREAATTAVIVAAAGNDDSATPFYPAAYPEVIAVAATGTTDQKAVFSNYGPWVDLAAPGELMQTTTISDYTAPSGTSVATPLVAGVAGLLKSQHPDWSPTLITWQLLNTVAPVDVVNLTHAGQLGHGRLDAGAALTQPPQARVQVVGYMVDGQSNGRPAPGQSFPLVLTLRNIWMPGQSLVGSVTTTDPYVTIGDPQGVFGDMGPGETTQNSSDPFGVTLQPNTPYNRLLPLTLTLTGANGYTTTVPFMLQVRTAVETLGNTLYTQNTTWTSDKTYVLNGTVIVGQGITLTIQPGTVVKSNSSKFIRVDGTLIAQGTEQSPITFTTNAVINEQWAGIRFADTAVSASFDLDGNYIAGSILRHVEISYASTGVNLGTRAPYIVASTFDHNDTALQTHSNAPRIEQNTFRENVTAISLRSSDPIISNNYFIRNRNATMGSAIEGDGSPQIIGNTITDERGSLIIRLVGGYVVIRDNRIINNTGIVRISGHQVDIKHNLIASNRTFCPFPPCSFTGVAVELTVQAASGSTVHNNTIINNSGYGIQLQWVRENSVVIANNNLFGNHGYDLYLSNGQAGTQNFTVNATNNFWNVDAAAIAGRIHDCTFDENGCSSPSSTLGKVQYDPALTEPSQSAPAFVRLATLDPDPVGLNQPGTVTLDFSRPMITDTLPTVTFHDARRGVIQKFNSQNVRDITQDTLGRIWFATDQGAKMFDGRQWYTYTTSSGLGNNNTHVIYSAANGDVWFGGVSMFAAEAPLSRLQGSTWITYNQAPNMNQGPVLAIGQDASGAMWFGAGERGVYRFDGVTWQQFTTADGLSANYVRRIVRDVQGRLWFMTGLGMAQSEPGGLDVFDGIRWQTYNRATGMPTNAFAALFADSQGRVWASISAVPNQQFYIAMFDGTAWRFFGLSETNGRLSCTVSSFAEASNGAIWMNSCNGTVTYQSGVWENVTNALTGGSVFFIDEQDNFWYNNMQVRWGGLNYPFENGRWLSPTRYQSNYNFTALVPQGVYAVDVNGATGTDGIEVVSGVANTFRVDFGIAANPAPPFAPAVTAENNGTLTTITARWRTDSLDVDHYRYAIGTTPGARNVVGWTYLTTTSMTRTDLVLIQGQSYYVSIQVRNKFGLWSTSGVSNQVIGGVVTPLPTPATPPPGAPTATPAGGTPTPTPTPVGGTPVLTPTMTMTPLPSQSLNAIGETTGASGSRFIFTGSGFPPNTQLPVAVKLLSNASAAGSLVMVGVVTADTQGGFVLTLVTDANLAAGRYRLTVGDQQTATVAFEVNPTAPLLQPNTQGAIITMAKAIYLPLIQR